MWLRLSLARAAYIYIINKITYNNRTFWMIDITINIFAKRQPVYAVENRPQKSHSHIYRKFICCFASSFSAIASHFTPHTVWRKIQSQKCTICVFCSLHQRIYRIIFSESIQMNLVRQNHYYLLYIYISYMHNTTIRSSYNILIFGERPSGSRLF